MAPQLSKIGRRSVGNSGEVCIVACLDDAFDRFLHTWRCGICGEHTKMYQSFPVKPDGETTLQIT